MSSRTRSRRAASIGSNQSSRRWAAVSAADCRATDFVLLLVMAWSPPARKRRHRLGFNHPETTPPAIPTTPRTAPADTSGICTLQLPDLVVLCFTYNRQNIKGVEAVAESITRRGQTGLKQR